MLKYREFLLEENIMDNPNFLSWFGKSKVVDKDGNPLVVYHASRNEIQEFSLRKSGKANFEAGIGFWFGDKRTDISAFGNKKIKVYLRIERPLIFKKSLGSSDKGSYQNFDYEMRKRQEDIISKMFNIDKENWAAIDDIVRYAQAMSNSDEFVLYRSASGVGYPDKVLTLNGKKVRGKELLEIVTKELRDSIIREGYDGIIIEDMNLDTKPGQSENTQYVVFNPNQIKSVDNTGSFSKSSNNIYENEKV